MVQNPFLEGGLTKAKGIKSEVSREAASKSFCHNFSNTYVERERERERERGIGY